MVNDLLYSDLKHGKYDKAKEFKKDWIRELKGSLSRIITVADCGDNCADPVDWENVESVHGIIIKIFDWRLPRIVALFVPYKWFAANIHPYNC